MAAVSVSKFTNGSSVIIEIKYHLTISVVWLYEVLLAIVISLITGLVLGKLFVWSDKKKYVETDSYFAARASIAIFIMGITRLLGQDEVLSAFVGGVAFGWKESVSEHRQETLTLSVIVFVLSIAFFIFFGTILPYGRWADLGIGRLIGCTFLIFFLKRIPFILLFKRPLEEIQTKKQVTKRNN
jgi:NhaP-type Na+/H+ or K+/H+ antiporter